MGKSRFNNKATTHLSQFVGPLAKKDQQDTKDSTKAQEDPEPPTVFFVPDDSWDDSWDYLRDFLREFAEFAAGLLPAAELFSSLPVSDPGTGKYLIKNDLEEISARAMRLKGLLQDLQNKVIIAVNELGEAPHVVDISSGFVTPGCLPVEAHELLCQMFAAAHKYAGACCKHGIPPVYDMSLLHELIGIRIGHYRAFMRDIPHVLECLTAAPREEDEEYDSFAEHDDHHNSPKEVNNHFPKRINFGSFGPGELNALLCS